MLRRLFAPLVALMLIVAACGGETTFSHTFAGSSWLTTPSGSAFVIHDERRDGAGSFRVTSLIDDSALVLLLSSRAGG